MSSIMKIFITQNETRIQLENYAHLPACEFNGVNTKAIRNTSITHTLVLWGSPKIKRLTTTKKKSNFFVNYTEFGVVYWFFITADSSWWTMCEMWAFTRMLFIENATGNILRVFKLNCSQRGNFVSKIFFIEFPHRLKEDSLKSADICEGFTLSSNRSPFFPLQMNAGWKWIQKNFLMRFHSAQKI